MSDCFSLVYGLRVRSNRPIPRVRPVAPTPDFDLDVCLNEASRSSGRSPKHSDTWYGSRDRDAAGQPLLVIRKTDEDSGFRFSYSDGTEFVVDRSGTSVSATWPNEATVDDTATYLLGPVMGFVLLLRGIHSLHGSAIVVGDEAFAIVGPAGGGKSTTAAAFAGLGYPVLSEDVTALVPQGGVFHVQPAYPCIRLWPESVKALFGSTDALPLLTPNWDKRYLDLGDDKHRFQRDPVRLAAIYLLGERADEAAAPRVERITPAAAMVALTANAYVPYLKDKAARREEFELLGRIARSLPVRRVIPHADPRRITQLCNALLADFQSRACPPVAPTCIREIERV